MGSTSEACLALAHSQDFAGYASLQPSVLVQHWWTHSMTAKAFRESRSSDTPREQLRLKLLTSDHGGEWLLLNPCGTLVSSAEFRLLLRFRLGITLRASPRLCGYCHKLLSAPEELKGDHAICCIKAGYITLVLRGLMKMFRLSRAALRESNSGSSVGNGACIVASSAYQPDHNTPGVRLTSTKCIQGKRQLCMYIHSHK